MILADTLLVELQIAAKLEEEKCRVEAEVLATARIATGLETRLRAAQSAQEAANAQAAAALQQAADVGSPPVAVICLCPGYIGLQARGDVVCLWQSAACMLCPSCISWQNRLRGVLQLELMPLLVSVTGGMHDQ